MFGEILREVTDASEPEFRDLVLLAGVALGNGSIYCDQTEGEPARLRVRSDAELVAKYKAGLSRANDDLDRALALTEEEAAELADAEFEAARAEWVRGNVSRRAKTHRLGLLADQLDVWEAPSEGSPLAKRWMQEYIELEKLENDSTESQMPVRKTGEEYREGLVEDAWWAIRFYTGMQLSTTLRRLERQEWVDALNSSLPEPAPAVPDSIWTRLDG